MRFRLFIVDKNTWPEHKRAGIAGINDPLTKDPKLKKQRQSAICEVAGIQKGDYLFFYMRGTKEIMGLYQATTPAYYDPSPLYPGARHVGRRFPFRIGFRQVINYLHPISIDDIWQARDRGEIWSMQQSRGDVVGVFGAHGLSASEGLLIKRMFDESNLIQAAPSPSPPLPSSKRRRPLPIDLSTEDGDELHYQDAMKALLILELARGKHRKIFGEYDDFIPKIPTSERTEMDLLLLKYDSSNNPLWFHVLELDAHTFEVDALKKLLRYRRWVIKVPAKENARAVHASAVAYDFSPDVKEYAKRMETPVRLIKYSFDAKTRSLTFTDVTSQ